MDDYIDTSDEKLLNSNYIVLEKIKMRIDKVNQGYTLVKKGNIINPYVSRGGRTVFLSSIPMLFCTGIIKFAECYSNYKKSGTHHDIFEFLGKFPEGFGEYLNIEINGMYINAFVGGLTVLAGSSLINYLYKVIGNNVEKVKFNIYKDEVERLCSILPRDITLADVNNLLNGFLNNDNSHTTAMLEGLLAKIDLRDLKKYFNEIIIKFAELKKIENSWDKTKMINGDPSKDDWDKFAIKFNELVDILKVAYCDETISNRFKYNSTVFDLVSNFGIKDPDVEYGRGR